MTSDKQSLSPTPGDPYNLQSYQEHISLDSHIKSQKELLDWQKNKIELLENSIKNEDRLMEKLVVNIQSYNFIVFALFTMLFFLAFVNYKFGGLMQMGTELEQAFQPIKNQARWKNWQFRPDGAKMRALDSSNYLNYLIYFTC